jgi:hypothetical protein
MKIRITFDLDETARLAIANQTGRKKPASYEECKNAIESIVEGEIEVYIFDFEKKAGDAGEE